MSRPRSRSCYSLDGALVCGPPPRSPEALAEVRDTVARFRRHLAGAMPMSEAREWAGLSVGQAARVTGIEPDRLRALESGAETPTALELAACMDAYGARGFGEPAPAGEAAR